MLASIFYFVGLFLFLFNLILITNFPKFIFVKEFSEKFLKVTNKRPEKKDFSNGNYEFYNFYIVTLATTTLWFFIGLIGSNWLVFLSYFGFIIILSPIAKSIKLKPIVVLLNLLILLFSTFLLGLLVFNHFHLHLNLTKYLLG